ncbi:aminodeoxychorismate synthase [Shouchella lonarensis]|uniref:aminodeoxychorismate synthase n=1 Tax=Shouchella lonarensis TaxID=1464122 RepID=A0A1G6INJ8_9BACI|nr:aminodeoxychorismate synthase [Shouchella lonarensis]SDC08023.1 para-aminobenzoate synthetase [Shouchella lonarensis]
MRTLLIDNYDSYTYNIYQLVAEVSGTEPVVVKNDACSFEELAVHTFDQIIISPGPGRPERAVDMGLSKEVIEKARVPVLGICLGHQGIAYHFGANIVHAPEVMHGRLSPIYHNDDPLFRGIPQGAEVVRYHSLVVEQETIPKDLEVIAWTKAHTVMGLRHKTLPLWAVQYHPESICTDSGKRLLTNFCDLTRSFHRNKVAAKCQPPKVDRSPSLIQPSSAFQVTVKEMPFHRSEAVFQTLFSKSKHAFWLDSSKTGDAARYSFMGDDAGPNSHVVTYDTSTGILKFVFKDREETRQESIFSYLKRQLHMLKSHDEWPFPFHCGYVGYFGYELKRECNNVTNIYQADTPDAAFLFADRMLVFDHVDEKMYAVCFSGKEDRTLREAWFSEIENHLQNLKDPRTQTKKGKPLSTTCNKSYQQYCANIEKVQAYLKDGETYELNYTTRLRTNLDVASLDLYQHLRRVNPAPYAAYMSFNRLSVLCSSPEKFITIDRRGHVCTKPIKGTMRRGSSPEEDEQLKKALETSEKDRAENLMIVDLLRNDLGKLCQVGQVRVPQLMEVESYQTVHQLVSTVTGILRDGVTAIDCIQATFPGGSMTGAPKVRTMSLIDSLEGESRGIYSGAIGYFSLDGTADFNIVIRTIVLEEGRATIGVGGAVTVQSTAAGEYEEMWLKASALVQAMEEVSCK